MIVGRGIGGEVDEAGEVSNTRPSVFPLKVGCVSRHFFYCCYHLLNQSEEACDSVTGAALAGIGPASDCMD